MNGTLAAVSTALGAQELSGGTGDCTMSEMTATDPRRAGPAAPAAVSMRGAGLTYGDQPLWAGLDLDVAPGEFVAVLGPNGAGKTSLLRVLLGQTALTTGRVEVGGRPVHRGSPRIGYVPQQKSFDPGLPLRARDLVGFGIDGHRWGLTLPSRARRARVGRGADRGGRARPTPTRPSGCCPAANSSGCGSRRR